MIIEEYDESLFIQRFENYNRVETEQNPKGNFSYKGLRFLFEYLEEAYDEENPLRLDVISLCCDFSEYKDLREYLKDYLNQHDEKQSFVEFIKKSKPELLKEFEQYKKDSIKNGVNLAENFFNWVSMILKEKDLIKEFKELEEEFKERISEEISDKTTLIKFDEDLNKGFIIGNY